MPWRARAETARDQIPSRALLTSDGGLAFALSAMRFICSVEFVGLVVGTVLTVASLAVLNDNQRAYADCRVDQGRTVCMIKVYGR